MHGPATDRRNDPLRAIPGDALSTGEHRARPRGGGCGVHCFLFGGLRLRTHALGARHRGQDRGLRRHMRARVPSLRRHTRLLALRFDSGPCGADQGVRLRRGLLHCRGIPRVARRERPAQRPGAHPCLSCRRSGRDPHRLSLCGGGQLVPRWLRQPPQCRPAPGTGPRADGGSREFHSHGAPRRHQEFHHFGHSR